MRVAKTAVVGLLLSAMASAARASEAVPPAAESDRIDALIAQLGGEDYEQRLAAMETLRKTGYQAVSKLRKARDTTGNREISVRLRRILDEGFVYSPELVGTSITGTVRFNGPPPPRKVMDVSSTQSATEVLGKEKLLADNLVVGSEGQLANVAVYVSKGLEGLRFEPPREPAEMSSQGLRFQPHVLTLMKDQDVGLRHVYSFLINWHAVGRFNFGAVRPEVRIQRFAESGIVLLKSDCCSWMRAYFVVLDNPFHAVTKEDGTFEIKGLVPGTYTLTFWHEELGTLTQEVAVGEKEDKEMTAVFEPKK